MTQSFLKDLEEQLVERTERGLPQERVRRRGLVAIVPALAAAAAVIAVVVIAVTGTGGHRSSPQPASHRHVVVVRRIVRHRVVTETVTASQGSPPAVGPTSPAAPTPASAPAGPVPSGFQPQSFTAISETQWWLLGQAPCSDAPCTSIVRTDDGGRSFVGVPAPRTDGVTQIRFANPEDGYAYGPQLWTTTDAGRTWHQVTLDGSVNDVSPDGGVVYATVGTRLERASVGTDDWTILSDVGEVYGGLWSQGSDVFVESVPGSGTADELSVSTDEGASFTRDRVPPGAGACNVESVDPAVVWAQCSSAATAMTVWRSTNGGVSFGPGESPGEAPASASFAAASDEVAVTGAGQLFRTIDGGASWSKVSAPISTNWNYLGFTDPTHGVALGEFGSGTARLYYTTDGGASYHLVPISGSG